MFYNFKSLLEVIEKVIKTEQAGPRNATQVTEVGWKQNSCGLCVEEHQVEPIGISPISTPCLFWGWGFVMIVPVHFEDFSA